MVVCLFIVITFFVLLILFSVVNYYVANKALIKQKRIQVYCSLVMCAICSIVPSVLVWLEFGAFKYFVYSIMLFMLSFFMVLFIGIVYDLASMISRTNLYEKFLKKK
ncbi:MAG: hypothetical protein BWY04_01050 [candidate division CPR1 bacterium ADurb.Bin160]|uniref:Uncharacterized protein n=1 Tax=candidate division CPR1 bacterium ADurb.Bin160 TaxID=1852826 RepID=A0A1V5ZLG5_9BACT|nr:MAG: hypothetical protein BWY04_01050 [candidate division CPR1 bacterium ADurb.Bin160]